MEISKEQVLKMISQTSFASAMEDLSAREMDVFTATSYEDEDYRVWFFHIQGSPAKGVGIIRREKGGYKVSFCLYGGKLRTYYFNKDFKKSTWLKLHSDR